MRNFQVATFLCMVLLFASCDKQPDEVATPDYFPMEIGNQWTFGERIFDIETEVLGPYNSNIIVHTVVDTETIDGEVYFKFEKVVNQQTPSFYYRRLAANGNLVDEVGRVHFSLTNFTDILFTDDLPEGINAYVTDMDYNMVMPSDPVVVPAGEFSTLRFRGAADYLEPNEYGLTEAVCTFDYSAGVGPVQETAMYILGKDTRYRDLISYSLN